MRVLLLSLFPLVASAQTLTLGTVVSSTGKILFSGTVTPNIVCGNGVTPQLTTSTVITID